MQDFAIDVTSSTTAGSPDLQPLISRRAATRVGVALTVLTAVNFAVFAIAGGAVGWDTVVVAFIAIMAYSIVGTLVVGRQPTNNLAWIFCVAPFVISLAGVSSAVLKLGRILDRKITPGESTLKLSPPRRLEHRRTARHANPVAETLRTCRSCGSALQAGSRDPYCSTCAPPRSTNAREAHHQAARRVPQARRDSLRRQRLAALEWDRTHTERPSPEEFTTQILPQLEGMSYSALSRQTGLSRRYIKLIMTEDCVPHPMHWDAFCKTKASPMRHPKL